MQPLARPFRAAFMAVIVLTVLLVLMSAPSVSQADEQDRMAEASWQLFTGSRSERQAALDSIAARQNPDMLATLILALRFRAFDDTALNKAAQEITGADAEGWFDWMLWQEKHPEFPAHASYRRVKLAVFFNIDRNFARFLAPETTDPQEMKIRLEEISWGGVVVDGIPSLDNPDFISGNDADYLVPDDLVFGVAINGDARAYPLRIMGWHEMFNDVIGGQPVALAYCTLCGAGILFETDNIPGFDSPLVFGSSGFLYRSNKLMFDRATDSLWNQFTGEPVVGPLVNSGITLKQRPVVITSWEHWKTANPETKVLSLNTGHRRDYGSGVVYRDYFASPGLMFPALVDESRLKQKDYVFGIRQPLVSKAWPLTAFDGGRVLNDAIGTLPLVLVGDAATRTVRAYDRGDLSFKEGAGADELTDDQGQVWRMEEDALKGPNGQLAPRVAGHVAYWFAWDGYLGAKSELYSDQQ
ncbi:DUF3179 domain-containing protein [Rhodovibrionaceae bacterium A322]